MYIGNSFSKIRSTFYLLQRFSLCFSSDKEFRYNISLWEKFFLTWDHSNTKKNLISIYKAIRWQFNLSHNWSCVHGNRACATILPVLAAVVDRDARKWYWTDSKCNVRHTNTSLSSRMIFWRGCVVCNVQTDLAFFYIVINWSSLCESKYCHPRCMSLKALQVSRNDDLPLPQYRILFLAFVE